MTATALFTYFFSFLAIFSSPFLLSCAFLSFPDFVFSFLPFSPPPSHYAHTVLASTIRVRKLLTPPSPLYVLLTLALQGEPKYVRIRTNKLYLEKVKLKD